MLAAISDKWQSLSVRIALACAMALLFRVVLDFLYASFMSRFYASSPTLSFPLIANSVPRLLESYAIALGLAICLVASLYNRWRPSGIVLVLYFVVVMLPLSSLYGLADASASFVYAATISFAVLIAATELLPMVKVPRPGRYLFYLGLLAVVGISAYVYGWLSLTGGLERLNFDLLSVYEVRADYVQTRGPLIGYFVPWQANVFNLIILCYGLEKRNYWLLGLVSLAQLFLFGMTGHKSFLMAPLLAGGVFFIWQKKNAISYVLLGASLVAVASYAYFLITGNMFVPSLFIHRLLFVPAGLHLVYYDFFSQPEHPLYMLSDSLLSNFVQNPYGISMPSLITSSYWDVDFNPNVGYLGDAYGNFGVLGMLLFSAILGVALRIVDGVGSSLPSHFVAAAISMPAISITQSALFTSMLTHGLIPAILMLWIFRALVGARDGRKSR